MVEGVHVTPERLLEVTDMVAAQHRYRYRPVTTENTSLPDSEGTRRRDGARSGSVALQKSIDGLQNMLLLMSRKRLNQFQAAKNLAAGLQSALFAFGLEQIVGADFQSSGEADSHIRP
jgi:hypothetical protein